MAKRMVTRTVTITTGTAVLINVNDLTPSEMSFQLPGEFKTPEHVMKSLTAALESDWETAGDGLKVIAVKNIKKKEVRYGMTEEDFIASAVVLPPIPERKEKTEA